MPTRIQKQLPRELLLQIGNYSYINWRLDRFRKKKEDPLKLRTNLAGIMPREILHSIRVIGQHRQEKENRQLMVEAQERARVAGYEKITIKTVNQEKALFYGYSNPTDSTYCMSVTLTPRLFRIKTINGEKVLIVYDMDPNQRRHTRLNEETKPLLEEYLRCLFWRGIEHIGLKWPTPMKWVELLELQGEEKHSRKVFSGFTRESVSTLNRYMKKERGIKGVLNNLGTLFF